MRALLLILTLVLLGTQVFASDQPSPVLGEPSEGAKEVEASFWGNQGIYNFNHNAQVETFHEIVDVEGEDGSVTQHRVKVRFIPFRAQYFKKNGDISNNGFVYFEVEASNSDDLDSSGTGGSLFSIYTMDYNENGSNMGKALGIMNSKTTVGDTKIEETHIRLLEGVISKLERKGMVPKTSIPATFYTRKSFSLDMARIIQEITDGGSTVTNYSGFGVAGGICSGMETKGKEMDFLWEGCVNADAMVSWPTDLPEDYAYVSGEISAKAGHRRSLVHLAAKLNVTHSTDGRTKKHGSINFVVPIWSKKPIRVPAPRFNETKN